MKKHDIYDVMNAGMDDAWVPVEVAQALYDALIKSVEHMDTVNTPSNHSVVIEATQAISLADGEE